MPCAIWNQLLEFARTGQSTTGSKWLHRSQSHTSPFALVSDSVHRNFRLIFEIRMIKGNHSGVGFWGKQHSFGGEDFTWKGRVQQHDDDDARVHDDVLRVLPSAKPTANACCAGHVAILPQGNGIFDIYNRGWEASRSPFLICPGCARRLSHHDARNSRTFFWRGTPPPQARVKREGTSDGVSGDWLCDNGLQKDVRAHPHHLAVLPNCSNACHPCHAMSERAANCLVVIVASQYIALHGWNRVRSRTIKM